MKRFKYKVGQSINWYKATWDGTLNPIAFIACQGFVLENKIFGNGRKLAVFLIKKNIMCIAYDINDLNRFGGYLTKLWKEDLQVFDRHKKNYFKNFASLKKIYKKIKKTKLGDLSNQELIELYSELLDSYLKFIGSSAFCEPVIVYLQPFIDKILNKCLKNYSKELCQALTIPSRLSFLGEKELLELKITLKVIQDNNIKKTFKRDANQILNHLKLSKNGLGILKFLKSLQNDYYWVRNNYVQTKYLSLNFFVEEIQNTAKKHSFSPKKIKNKIDKIKSFQKLRRVAYIKMKPDNQDKFYLNLLDEIGFLQDTRKKIYIEGIEYFNRLFRELSQRTKIQEKIIKFFLPEEINQIFDIKKQNKLESLAVERYNQCAVIFKNDKIIIEADPQKVSKIKKWIISESRDIKKLKGTPVSIGPKIKGRCRILLSASGINKIKKGDILVTSSTAPDYLPAMKKAAAILTEKGGLTSHAAIVSRELGVPCIVGIFNLISLLKDGDLVEVDAEKGVVKIINKAK